MVGALGVPLGGNWEFRWGAVELGDLIGKGSFGKVGLQTLPVATMDATLPS